MLGGGKERMLYKILEKKFVTDLASALLYIDSRFIKTLDQKYNSNNLEFFGRSKQKI